MSTGFSAEIHAMIDGRSGGRCEVCGTGAVTEHHHRRPRASGGTRRLDTNRLANGLGLCGPCHRLVECHRTVALLLGWLIQQHQNPSANPVMYRGKWAWLQDDGMVLDEPVTEC